MAGAALVGGMLSGLVISSSLVTGSQVLVSWILCITGGILPDIDSDSSRVSQMFFTILAAIAVVGFTLQFHPLFSLFQLWAAMLVVFILVRFTMRTVVHRLTVHRGIFHSLLAAVSLSLATLFFVNRFYPDHDVFSWVAAISLFTGYMTHLLLDECYSVDLEGLTIKRSFGSAIKPFSLNSVPASLMMLLVGAIFYGLVPSHLLSTDTFELLKLQDTFLTKLP